MLQLIWSPWQANATWLTAISFASFLTPVVGLSLRNKQFITIVEFLEVSQATNSQHGTLCLGLVHSAAMDKKLACPIVRNRHESGTLRHFLYFFYGGKGLCVLWSIRNSYCMSNVMWIYSFHSERQDINWNISMRLKYYLKDKFRTAKLVYILPRS